MADAVAPEHDAPACPACGLHVATPIADIGGGCTTDRWDGPRDATLWCPSCGAGWVGTPADVAQATEALAAYYRCSPPPPEPVVDRAAPQPEAVGPRQLTLFGDARG